MQKKLRKKQEPDNEDTLCIPTYISNIMSTEITYENEYEERENTKILSEWFEKNKKQLQKQYTQARARETKEGPEKGIQREAEAEAEVAPEIKRE